MSNRENPCTVQIESSPTQVRLALFARVKQVESKSYQLFYLRSCSLYASLSYYEISHRPFHPFNFLLSTIVRTTMYSFVPDFWFQQENGHQHLAIILKPSGTFPLSASVFVKHICIVCISNCYKALYMHLKWSGSHSRDKLWK